ncbi:MAG: hypothetical protein QNK04_10645 [Myxococcota bacterium]|nr:hypothetical protein [Myxococcota bacterium]
MSSQYHPANLDEAGLETLRGLESDIGAVAVALEAQAPPADLSDEQVARLKEVEQRLGVVIVAYDQA